MQIFEKVECHYNPNVTIALALMILVLCLIIFTAPYYLVLAFKPTPPTEQPLPQNMNPSRNVTLNGPANATGEVLIEANKVINAASNTTTNATNATGTTMTQPESVVSTASNITSNATETGNPMLDALKSIFGGITGNNITSTNKNITPGNVSGGTFGNMSTFTGNMTSGTALTGNMSSGIP